MPILGVAVVDLAARQHGVLSRRQLVAAEGITDHRVDGLLERGWLRPVHRGVYALGRAPLSHRGRWQAALLVAPAGAVLSHETAAAAWGLQWPRAAVHLTCSDRSGRRPRQEGVVAHRSSLPEAEIGQHAGFPVTSVARTLLDLAATVPRAVPRAITEAERLRLFDLGAVEALLAGGRPGAPALRRAVESWDPSSTLTRSALEDQFLALCHRHGIPRPQVNSPVGPYLADFLWPKQSLIVETDGAAYHSALGARERDSDRSVRLALLGFRVERVTFQQVERRPELVAAAVARWLQAA